ncbi:SDR family NAD(P)-dependent oxidoreductase [Thermodesulfobacteriota bacterium]
MSTSFSLEGMTALVTGGSKGIGEAIALAYAAAGADVAVCSQGTKEGQLEGVAGAIRALGRRSIAVRADTGLKIDVENMVREVMDEFGHIDILVNNAGILIRSPLLDLSEDDWDRIMNVDLKGYFLCAQAVGKQMVKQKRGIIINISTQHAFQASKIEMGAYGIAKAGVVLMTRYLARELGKDGIRANGIAPGLTKTEFSEPTWSNTDLLKNIEASLPLGRIAEAGDIVEAALFLASDAGRYITGHTILMDGGGNI